MSRGSSSSTGNSNSWGVRARIRRAMTQRMFMLGAEAEGSGSFQLMGASGTAYTVRVADDEITCSCPDHEERDSTCKHMMFLVGRVGGDAALLEELVEDRDAAVRAHGAAIRARILEGYARTRGSIPDAIDLGDGAGSGGSGSSRNKRRKLAAGERNSQGAEENEPSFVAPPRGNEACPICFEDFEGDAEAKTHCKRQCGHEFHSACVASWLTASAKENCPMCRVPWG